MRTALLGAATVAVLAAGALATTSVIGSSHREAPRIMLDPSADNTDVYAFVRATRPGKLNIDLELGPLQSPAGGPYFGKLDPTARYYVKIDNTGDGVEDVAYRWQFKNSSVTRTRSCTRSRRSTRSTTRTSTSSRRTTCTTSVYARQVVWTTAARSRQRAGRARQRRAEDDAELRGGLPNGAIRGHPRRRQDVRRPGRRPVLRRPRRDLRRHRHRQARPPGDRARQPGRRQGRRVGLQHPFVRAAGAESEVTRDGRSVTDATARTRSSASGRPPSAGVKVKRGQGQGAMGPGQPPRQPADQRGHRPDRVEGPLQRDGPEDERQELRRRRD